MYQITNLSQFFHPCFYLSILKSLPFRFALICVSFLCLFARDILNSMFPRYVYSVQYIFWTLCSKQRYCIPLSQSFSLFLIYVSLYSPIITVLISSSFNKYFAFWKTTDNKKYFDKYYKLAKPLLLTKKKKRLNS